MSVDFDAYPDRSPPKVEGSTPDPSDLESIVTLLELGAIELTPRPGATFSFDQLVDAAREYGGGEHSLNRRDAEIVLPFLKFIVRRDGLLQLQ